MKQKLILPVQCGSLHNLQVNTSEAFTFSWLLIQKQAAVLRTIPSQEQRRRKCTQFNMSRQLTQPMGPWQNLQSDSKHWILFQDFGWQKNTASNLNELSHIAWYCYFDIVKFLSVYLNKTSLCPVLSLTHFKFNCFLVSKWTHTHASWHHLSVPLPEQTCTWRRLWEGNTS